MILCGLDVDAMAAGRILSYMLRNDGIIHSIAPCPSYSSLLTQLGKTNNNNNHNIKALVLLNLGATRNLTRLFEDDDDSLNNALLNPEVTKVYVMDCRRPVHLANVHSGSNIVVFWDGTQNLDEIPSDGDNLSGNDTSSSSSSSSSDEESTDRDEDDNDDEEHEFHDDDEDDDEEEQAFEEQPTQLVDPAVEQESDYDGEDERDEEHKQHGRYSKKPLEAVATLETEKDDSDEEENEDHQKEEQSTSSGKSNTEKENEPAMEQMPTMTPREIHLARRQKLQSYYASGSYYGSPASYVLYSVATQLRFGNNADLLWLACVGVTDAYLHARLDVAGYSVLALELRNHCHRLFPSKDEFSRATDTVYAEHLLGTSNIQQQQLTKIGFSRNGEILSETDFRFFLLRHWSLLDAMRYSEYMATKFQLTTSRGNYKLHEMLAKMGYPLAECQQPFAFLKPSLRRQLPEKFREFAEEYGLENFEFTSFFRITGYQSLLSASDTAYAVSALLECEPLVATQKEASSLNKDDNRLLKAFNVAFDALNSNQTLPSVGLVGLSSTTEGNSLSSLVNGGNLGSGNATGLGAGIQLAMSLQKTIMATAANLIDRNAVTRLSHFRYAYLTCTSQGENSIIASGVDDDRNNARYSEDEPATMSDHIFAKPLVLTRLAHYLMDLHRENGKWAGNKAGPLILMAEKPRTKTFLVVGYEYPESSGDFVRNRFGKNFELAAQSMQGEFLFDSFDSNVVEVARADVQRFIEQLHYLMAQI
jgi:cell division control protein 45